LSGFLTEQLEINGLSPLGHQPAVISSSRSNLEALGLALSYRFGNLQGPAHARTHQSR